MKHLVKHSLLLLTTGSLLLTLLYITARAHLRPIPTVQQQQQQQQQLQTSSPKLFAMNDEPPKVLSDDPECLELLYGDGNSSLVDKRRPDNTTDQQVLNTFALGCQEFKRRYLFEINEDPIHITAEERYYPIAFSILTHSNAHQTVRLLSAIYAPQNVYCIHVDKKANSFLASTVSLLSSCLPNVFRSSSSEDVVYAGFSRLQADIDCMSDLLDSEVKWTHLVNLCSQDFPLYTNLEMVKQLRALKGRNSIGGHLPGQSDLERTLYVHKVVQNTNSQGHVTNVMARTGELKQPPPYNMTVYKNLAYNVFARPFLRWVLRESVKAKALLEWSRDSYSPDEHFWKMLDNLHGEAPSVSARSDQWQVSRYINWWGPNKPCAGFWRHFHCTFGVGDLQTIRDQRVLFVNKFDVTHDSRAPSCMRKWLDERKRRVDERNPNKEPRLP